ncbi:unnamed protein product (macronuclear) [Paramecium tetraurelia]|uniref:Uncharacterized protein n=1 Tax=Paramecium tetraurelia TaxID=5888 RepID=A0BN63_PARTE|nr:uncharacterized protein GSPATT00030618001 [Paramecium tetraurelia]CAK59980.1 unnamed protein product [Paramecium tetraurelia]|eukprot:XP_001427378.1 hypothetical protein (macronuclear) [Paramecium tetraurelia strain d4-2]
MNLINHQHLIEREQNDQLLKQNQELQLTIQQLEQQVIGNRQQFNKMNPIHYSIQGTSKQKQIKLLRQVFGEFKDQIIQNQLEQNVYEQAKKLIEQLQDQGTLKITQNCKTDYPINKQKNKEGNRVCFLAE